MMGRSLDPAMEKLAQQIVSEKKTDIMLKIYNPHRLF